MARRWEEKHDKPLTKEQLAEFLAIRRVPDYVARHEGVKTSSSKGTADLRLYDDGWRVEHITLE
jgi:hypothetical protein